MRRAGRELGAPRRARTCAGNAGEHDIGRIAASCGTVVAAPSPACVQAVTMPPPAPEAARPSWQKPDRSGGCGALFGEQSMCEETGRSSELSGEAVVLGKGERHGDQFRFADEPARGHCRGVGRGSARGNGAQRGAGPGDPGSTTARCGKSSGVGGGRCARCREAGCTGAGIALKRMMEQDRTPGTIRVYGCAAEEGGAVKVYMVREGLFNDLDAARRNRSAGTTPYDTMPPPMT